MGYDVFFNCLNSENYPKRKKGGWFDIPLPYNVSYKAGEVVKLVFDLRVKMPFGYEGIIQPRSSTLEKTGLISSGFGVIEDSYCGEEDYIGYRFYATRDGLILSGECLVQMRFQKKMEDCVDSLVPDCWFTGVESRGGFGSTDNAELTDTHINRIVNWVKKPIIIKGFRQVLTKGIWADTKKVSEMDMIKP